MRKKVIISEAMMRRIAEEQIIQESGLDKSDVSKIVKDTLKTDRDVKKEMEKQVKELVAASVNTLFKTLWQRRNFYEDEIKK